MCKKHYERIARMIKDQLSDHDRVHNASVTTIARELAEIFAEDNHLFKMDKFLEAAGVEA